MSEQERQPTREEKRLMTLYGFDRRQDLVDWLNEPSDPALAELSSEAPISDWGQEEDEAEAEREVLAEIAELEKLEERMNWRPKRETVFLVAGGIGVLVGWLLLAHVEQLALSVLGCSERSWDGGCFAISMAKRLTVQIPGMVLVIAGGISVLMGPVDRHGRN